MCDLDCFLVEDINASIIQVWYNTDNTDNIFFVMKHDILEQLKNNIGDELSDDIGFYDTDALIDFKEFDRFMIRVYQELSKVHSEAPWPEEEIISYFEFIETLDDAEMIEYDERGIPHFVE